MISQQYEFRYGYGPNIQHAITRNFELIMSDFVVIPVPADGLAPLGARPSAGTVKTELGSYICTK